MFNQTVADEMGTPCQNIILFLTDGVVTSGETNPVALLLKIKNFNTNNATIFTYGLGSEVEMDILKQISC
jgi:hypothetical protein